MPSLLVAGSIATAILLTVGGLLIIAQMAVPRSDRGRQSPGPAFDLRRMATPGSGWRRLGPRVCRRLRQSRGQGRALARAEVRRANRAGGAGGASDPCRERSRDRLCLAAAVEPCGLSADPRPSRHGQAVGRAAERKRDLAGEGRLCLGSHPHHGRSRPGRLSHRGLCAPVGRRAAGAPQPRAAGRSAGAAL